MSCIIIWLLQIVKLWFDYDNINSYIAPIELNISNECVNGISSVNIDFVEENNNLDDQNRLITSAGTSG